MKRRYVSKRAGSIRMNDGVIHEQATSIVSNHEHEMVSVQNERGIEVEENRIYFYCPVGEQEALELNHLLRRLDVEMQYLSARLGCGVVPIHLHIHSPGGSLFSGLSIVDTMLRCKTPIHTYVEGSAASAATFIACCGTKGYRHIGKHSFMLVHQPQIEWAGKLDEFRDEIKNQKELFDKILQIYLDRTEFDQEELEELLQHELWLNADTCLEKGLADVIF
jgi:ATP-dependent Clp endopeptidase proteolytic subunit ClpP